MVVLGCKRVVRVDEGQRDLVSCAWKEEANEVAFSRFTNKEHHEKIDLR
jgi:hypothetical protein